MQKISLAKELFEDILLKKVAVLSKKNNKYWKKVLLEPKIANNKIEYSIKQIDTLTITNGLGKENPLLVIECKKIDYSSTKDCFEFTLGKVIEQRNTNLEENYKDNLIEQLLKEKELLEDKMNRDYLTKVYNRRKMEDDLEIFSRQSNSAFLSVIFIDVETLTSMSDTFGQETTNKSLIQLSQNLQNHAKLFNGEVYRYGEEEFAILCFIPKKHIIQKLNDLLEDIKDILLTVNIGVSFFTDAKNAKEMIQKATFAVYKAKNKGKNIIEFI